MTKIGCLFMWLSMSIVLLVNAAPAAALDAKATDAAFAALLSMPSAKPETGSWNFPDLADYRKGEKGLIAYLDQQQRKGADFNAYRHYGTLLHHSIRAKLTKTAFWLLEHGADPRKTLLNSTEDALALSVQYKQHAIAKVLRYKYSLTTLRIAPPANAVMAKPSKQLDTVDYDKLRRAQYAMHEDTSKPELSEKSLRALAAWEASVGTIPDDRYAAQMDDDDSLIRLVQAYSRTPDALDKALSRFPVAMLQRHRTALVGGLANVSNFNLPDGKTQAIYTVPEQSWRVLWRRVGQQVDYTQTLAAPGIWIVPLSTLAGRIQPTLWDELYASGYQEHQAENALGCLLNNMDVSSFKALWPNLPKYFPNIREAAPKMLLSGFRYRAPEDIGFCYSYSAEGLWDKLLFLSSIGISNHVKGIDKIALEGNSKDLLTAMVPFMKTTDPTTRTPRLVDTKPECQFSLTPLIYNALIDNAVVRDREGTEFDVHADSVQLIQIPHEVKCGLLVGGGSRVDGYVSGDYDSFTGPSSNPRPSCPDPTDRYEIWHEHKGKIEHLQVDMGYEDGAPMLSLIRDRNTGAHYYLNSGEQYGICHLSSPQRLPYLLAWKQSKTGWALKRDSSPELVDALYDQCDSENRAMRCNGIASLSSDDIADHPAPRQPATAYVYDLSTFIKTFRKHEYEAYLGAVFELDKPKLREFQQTGIPGDWTAEAIHKVGNSKLSLNEKRKRIAWLFYDHVQLERALARNSYSFDYDSLLSWLPEEDWRPILDIVAKYGSAKDYGLGHIRDVAAERGMTKLACGIDNARGLICGETWSTETTDSGQANSE